METEKQENNTQNIQFKHTSEAIKFNGNNFDEVYNWIKKHHLSIDDIELESFNNKPMIKLIVPQRWFMIHENYWIILIPKHLIGQYYGHEFIIMYDLEFKKRFNIN